MRRALVLALLAASTWLAGCASPDASVRSVDCADEPCESRSASLEGVVLELRTSEADGVHRVSATARNEGSEIFWYLWVPACGLEPWWDSMEGPDGPVQPREPVAHCLPCGWEALSPGESLSKAFDWDGRIWEDPDHDGEGRLRDAPAGRYSWSVTFYAGHSVEQACGTSDGSVTGSVGLDVR